MDSSESVSGAGAGVFGHQRCRLKVSRSNCALPVLVVLVLAAGWWSLMSRGEAAGRPPGAAIKPPFKGRGRAGKASEMCEEFEVVIGSKDEKLKAAFAFRGLGAYFLGYVLVFSLPLPVFHLFLQLIYLISRLVHRRPSFVNSTKLVPLPSDVVTSAINLSVTERSEPVLSAQEIRSTLRNLKKRATKASKRRTSTADKVRWS